VAFHAEATPGRPAFGSPYAWVSLSVLSAESSE
jgi:hypothetical protein